MAVITAIFAYVAISYVLLLLAGETELVAGEHFIYYLVVTGSTVGYGDFGPSTFWGRLAVSFWVIPIGLSLFAVVLGRAGVYLSELYNRRRRGLQMLDLTNHSVIIGWHGARSLRLIELVYSSLRDRDMQLVLVVDKDMENPASDKVSLVQVESYSDAITMERAKLSTAKSIVIDLEDDNETLATALYCASENPECHKTAYMANPSLIHLMGVHCPKVEVIPSVQVEMLASSAMDPGSAQVHQQLLDSTSGVTQYAILNPVQHAVTAKQMLEFLKFQLDATLIAYKRSADVSIVLNPKADVILKPGDILYYLSESRLTEAQLTQLKEA
ncbi:potassium channel family protein [Alginatibacterium sediminis]|nr:potassium channel family protein [Alginatibacterium sediminis]